MVRTWLGENFGLITRRFLAWLGDLWFCVIPIGLVFAITTTLTKATGGSTYSHAIMGYLHTEIIGMAYYTFTLAGKHQATPFMRLLRLKMIRSVDEGKPSYRQVFVAHFIFTIFQYWIVRMQTIPLFFGYTQAELLNLPTSFGHIYTALNTLGKQLSFTIICFPIFLSMGKKSLGNILSGTEIAYIPKNKKHHASPKQ